MRQHEPKHFTLSDPRTPAPSLVFPVAVSKPHLSRFASQKKNRKGHVIKITETSEKFFSQESESSE